MRGVFGIWGRRNLDDHIFSRFPEYGFEDQAGPAGMERGTENDDGVNFRIGSCVITKNMRFIERAFCFSGQNHLGK